MSTRINIRATETGVVRVFAVDLDREAAKRFSEQGDTWPVQDALGAVWLDAAHVDVFQVEDLEGFGLIQYLEEGMGVSFDDLEDAHVVLEALTGTVLVVRSSAFGGKAQEISPAAPLRLIATFNEEKPPVQFEKLPDGGAEGAPIETKKAPSDAAMSGRVAMVALLVIFALTGLVIWVAS